MTRLPLAESADIPIDLAVRDGHFGIQRRDQKLALQKKINELRKELGSLLAESLGSSKKAQHIAAWDPFDPQASSDFFDPHWMFGKALEDGFSIVIGNPPYLFISNLKQEVRETSAFRPIPSSWAALRHLQLVVSVDGLQPDHDLRRRPATYQRVLQNIRGHYVAIHCTITSAMTKRSGYIPEFLDFWSANPAVEKIWMSIFTPQRGAKNVECLTWDERRDVLDVLMRVRPDYPKLDMPEGMLREYLSPPVSPRQCIFAQTTRTISADFKTSVEPCQFGGDPDCSRCGCIASMGLAAIGHRKLVGPLTAGHLFWASAFIGQHVKFLERTLFQFVRR